MSPPLEDRDDAITVLGQIIPQVKSKSLIPSHKLTHHHLDPLCIFMMHRSDRTVQHPD